MTRAAAPARTFAALIPGQPRGYQGHSGGKGCLDSMLTEKCISVTG
jgi:hypothetical protein